MTPHEKEELVKALERFVSEPMECYRWYGGKGVRPGAYIIEQKNSAGIKRKPQKQAVMMKGRQRHRVNVRKRGRRGEKEVIPLRAD